MGGTERIVSNERDPKQPRRSGIYKILCEPTGKIYVGSAAWLAKRKRHHREAFLAGTHENPYLQRAWNKYGPDAFAYSVLEYCEKEKLTEREQHYIDTLGAAKRDCGFNLCPIAYSNLGRTFGPEMRAKISAAKKGKPGTLSVVQIEELRERMKGNTFRLGIKHTPESCEQMSKTRKGGPGNPGYRHTDEAKKKMSEVHKGKPLSAEHRKKISDANTGREHTIAHRLKFSLATSKIKPDQFDKIKAEYVPGVVSMRQIAEQYGCCAGTIGHIINGKRMVC